MCKNNGTVRTRYLYAMPDIIEEIVAGEFSHKHRSTKFFDFGVITNDSTSANLILVIRAPIGQFSLNEVKAEVKHACARF
jgi:hypothetical protein